MLYLNGPELCFSGALQGLEVYSTLSHSYRTLVFEVFRRPFVSSDLTTICEHKHHHEAHIAGKGTEMQSGSSAGPGAPGLPAADSRQKLKFPSSTLFFLFEVQS